MTADDMSCADLIEAAADSTHLDRGPCRQG